MAAPLVPDTLRRIRDNLTLGVAGTPRDAHLAMLAVTGRTLPGEIVPPLFCAPFAVIGEGSERVTRARAEAGTRLRYDGR